MTNLTEKDSLLYGVEYPEGSGTRHYDFEIRIALVGDEIDAYERPEIIGGGVSKMRVDNVILAACLETLGEIPVDSITPELLGTMVADDFSVMYAAQDRLKKKLLRPKQVADSAPTDSPSQSSDSTASQNSASAQ